MLAHRSISVLLVIFTVTTVQALPASAHGTMDVQVEALSRAIDLAPAHADPYVQRGDLYLHHDEWQQALDDYRRASALDPAIANLEVQRAKAYHGLGQNDAALALLDQAIATDPDSLDARLTRARVRRAIGDVRGSANDYEATLSLVPTRSPDLVIECADTCMQAADDGGVRALAVLDHAIEQLGPLATLETAAIHIELQRNDLPAALRRIDAMIAANGSNPRWLCRKAEILVRAGRRPEAIEVCRTVVSAIDGLPHARRRTRSMRTLRERVVEIIQRPDE
jgi:tetratricopeptide (TPR) repeat protein